MPHILVVEQHNDLRAFFVTIGKDLPGLTVHAVSSAEEALAYLKQEHPKPDLILATVGTRPMSGVELLRTVKEDQELTGIPFILMSGLYELNEDRAKNIGAQGFLQKPFALSELQRLIRQLVPQK